MVTASLVTATTAKATAVAAAAMTTEAAAAGAERQWCKWPRWPGHWRRPPRHQAVGGGRSGTRHASALAERKCPLAGWAPVAARPRVAPIATAADPRAATANATAAAAAAATAATAGGAPPSVRGRRRCR